MLTNPYLPKQVKILNYTVKFYPDEDLKYRWNITSNDNGEIVGASSQGFSSLQSCHNNFKLLQDFLKVYIIS